MSAEHQDLDRFLPPPDLTIVLDRGTCLLSSLARAGGDGGILMLVEDTRVKFSRRQAQADWFLVRLETPQKKIPEVKTVHDCEDYFVAPQSVVVPYLDALEVLVKVTVRGAENDLRRRIMPSNKIRSEADTPTIALEADLNILLRLNESNFGEQTQRWIVALITRIQNVLDTERTFGRTSIPLPA